MFWWFSESPEDTEAGNSQAVVVGVPTTEVKAIPPSKLNGVDELDAAPPTPIFIEPDPDRIPQSLGEDIDFDDLSVFDNIPVQSVGEDIDVDDLSVFEGGNSHRHW